MQTLAFVIRAFTFPLISLTLAGVFAILRRPRKEEYGKVSLPGFFVVLGTIGATVFLIPTLITAFSDEPIWISILFLLFSLGCCSLIVAHINCRITYDDQGFVAKSFWGFKRAFSYEQIAGIRENKHESYLYMGKRRVMVDEYGVGGKAFLSLAKKKYRTMHNGESIPQVPRRKDIFNGNIENPVALIVIFFLIAALGVAILVSTIYFGFCQQYTEDNTIKQSVCFNEGYVDPEDIVLVSDNNQIYKILFVDSHTPTDAVLAICDGKTLVTVYCTDANTEKDTGYFRVHGIVDNNTCILSFEETERLHRANFTLGIVVSGGLLLLWVAVGICTVIVARNPQKFSKRVRRWFIKDGYLRLSQTSKKQKKN